MRLRLASGLLAGALALCAAGLAPPVLASDVPGTRVSLDPPPEFAASDQFPGFQHVDAGSSIMVTELRDVGAAQVMAGMTREGLATRGMTLLTSETVTADGRDALLLHVRQAAGGAEFEKWMLVFGDDATALMIVGTFPRATAGSQSAPIRSAILSARWDPARQPGTFEGLPFHVRESDSLKVSRRIANTVMLTRDGATGTVAPGDPLLIVAASLGEPGIGDLETFARRRIAQTAQIEGLANLSGRALRVDSLPAYELTADATDLQSGRALRIYQLLIADGGRYFLVQGMVGAAAAGEFVPEFRQVASSLERAR